MTPLADRPESWPVVSSRDLHRDAWVMALRADRVQRPGASEEPFTRLVLEHPGAVVVLAIDDADRVLCLAQYRHPGGHRFVELPAGLIDAGDEPPLEVAKRELREEAGYEADDWTTLPPAYSSPGISTELIHYFVARGLREVGRGDFELRHEEADMTTFWAPYSELRAAVLAGDVRDAPLALVVLAAQAHGVV